MCDDRYEIIKKHVSGKDVLDLGCVDHDFWTASASTGQIFLHKFIKENAKSVVGIDASKDEVEKMNKSGYDVVCANVESFSLGRKFDVVIAGELIEHLKNPGMFLDSVKKHMHKDSRLILTTPNPFTLKQFLRIIFKGGMSVREDHTMLFDRQTLGYLLESSGLRMDEFYFVNYTKRMPHRLIAGALGFVLGRSLFGNNLLMVARLV